MSSRPTPGRRSDSLFDNRYRIEESYPRGRSGETLRAVDVQEGEQPVVIKRPALQDAPPMRTGQEQIILNEKRILERLAGVPGVAQLVRSGTFRVAGQAHQYLAEELAPGASLETLVQNLPAHEERLPDLELLVIFDKLIETLQAAHDLKVVHNNLGPNNVFWSRDQYCLKVTGWGSASLLDSDAPQTADLPQIGQVMAFAATSGQQSEAPERLKKILNRVSSSDHAYPSLGALREELAALRQPLEKDRNARFETLRASLSDSLDEESLIELRNSIQRLIVSDPGYPPAHVMLAEITKRLARTAFQDNLHAIYVYMTTGTTGRALAIIEELSAQADANLQPTLDFLRDACNMMREQPIMPLSAGLSEAINALLNGDPYTAGRFLVTTVETRPAARQQQYTLAEWLTERIPDVVLLRPHLTHLEDLLSAAPHTALHTIVIRLDRPLPKGIEPLKTLYQQTLQGLQALLSGDQPREEVENALQRASHAAELIVAELDTVQRCAFSDLAQANQALIRAKRIDPGNAGFDSAARTLIAFHAEIDSLHNFAPSDDGSDIAPFLADARTRLGVYLAEVTDPAFQALAHQVDEAIAALDQIGASIVMGGFRPALAACKQAAESTRLLNPAVAAWFDAYYKQIEHAPNVEHLSSNTALGNALEEGWELWDHGRGTEAQAAGKRALDLCKSDGERRAAQRLIDLSEVLAAWLANDGPMNSRRTEQAETRVLALLLPEEDSIRRTFARQMPDTSIYLKAMGRGIVEPMRESSAAGVRALFFHYALRGLLDLQQGNTERAIFWREAAFRALPTARLHPAFLALDSAITRWQLVLEAVNALNKVKQIADLPAARQAARAPLAAGQLEAAVQSTDALDQAIQRWTEGNFRGARQLIDRAAERIAFTEATLGMDLSPFKAWLQDLGASAEILHEARHAIEQIALVPDNEPNPAVTDAFQRMIEITRRDLTEAYTGTIRQWRDSYVSIRDIVLDEKLEAHEKLRLLDDYLEDEALESNPALPVLRFWYDRLRRLPPPEPPAPAFHAINPALYVPPPETSPGPRGVVPSTNVAQPRQPVSHASPVLVRPPATISPAMLAGSLVIVIVVVAIAGVLYLQNHRPTVYVPVFATTETGLSAAASNQPTAAIEQSPAAPSATFTEAPSATPPTLPPTITAVVPTPTTVLPTATIDVNASQSPPITPTIAPYPSGTLVASNGTIQPPTFVPTAQGGDYDLLQYLVTLSKPTWNKDTFAAAGDHWQLGTATFRSNGPPIVVRLGPDVMTPLFGVDAAKKLTHLEATLVLDSYDKSLLPIGNVKFSIGLESVNGPRVAVQANLVQANVVDLGINQNGTFLRKTEIPVNTVTMNVKIQRNADNTLSLYEGGQLLGQSGPSFGPNTPVAIYMYTSAGGIVVKVTSLKIHLE